MDALRASFAEEGFVVARDVLDEASFQRVRALMEDEAGRNASRVRQLLADGADVAQLDADDRELVSGNFARAFKAKREIGDLLRSPRLREILYTLLDTASLYLHMYPSPRCVLPANDLAAVPRHTDRQYNDHLSHFLTVWVPIDCFDATAGGVIVYPRSHRMRTPRTEERIPVGLWFAPTGDVADDQGVLQVLGPRDVLVMDEHLLHASAPNRSSRPRLSIDLRVFGGDAVTTKHYLDCQDWTVYPPPTGKRHGRKV